jgi:hypothetical protein
MNIRSLLAARLSDRSLSLIAIHRLKYRPKRYRLKYRKTLPPNATA